jgi:hypothetical protein
MRNSALVSSDEGKAPSEIRIAFARRVAKDVPLLE